MNKSTSGSNIYHKAKFWQLLLFATNDTATNASFGLFSSFFLLMTTENLLLSAVVVGFIMTGSRILDGFTDPLIGMLIDKTITRFGKFRPFMLLGSVIINLGVLMIFGNFFTFNSKGAYYAWLIIWYAFYIIGYTFQTATTKAGQVQLTNDPSQRPILGAINTIVTMLYFIPFLTFGIKYVLSFGGFNVATGYRNLAYFVVIVNVVLTILSMIGISEADQPEKYRSYKSNNKFSFKKIFDIVKRNRAMQMLIIAASTNKLAQTLLGAVTAYYYTYTVKNIDLQPIATGISSIVGLAGIFIGMSIAIKKDKKTSFVVGSWLSIIVGVAIMIIQPFSPGQTAIFIVLTVVLSVVNSIATTNVIPMIADVADYELWRSGDFNPGIVGTTFSFVDKLVSSAAGSLVGVVLGAIGYEAGMEPTSTLYWTFLILMIGTPTIGHICSVIAYKWYPIDKAFYEKMHLEINERSKMNIIKDSSNRSLKEIY